MISLSLCHWPVLRSCFNSRLSPFVRIALISGQLNPGCHSPSRTGLWDAGIPEPILNNRQRLKFLSENGLALGFKPVFENGGIDRAEVHAVFQIALEKVGGRETRMTAKEAGFDLLTDDKYRSGS